MLWGCETHNTGTECFCCGIYIKHVCAHWFTGLAVSCFQTLWLKRLRSKFHNNRKRKESALDVVIANQQNSANPQKRSQWTQGNPKVRIRRDVRHGQLPALRPSQRGPGIYQTAYLLAQEHGARAEGRGCAQGEKIDGPRSARQTEACHFRWREASCHTRGLPVAG